MEPMGVENLYKIGQESYVVYQLVRLLSSIPASNIDEVVARAKDQLTLEQKRVKLENLKRLFNSYLDRLASRGCPKQILEMARERCGEVVVKASEMTIPEGHIPFVGPIIKPTYLGYYGLISMVKNCNNEGHIHLDPSKIIDEFSTPDGLYWIYDVDNGEAMRGKTPQNAEKLIKEQGRSGLTAIEVASLGALKDVLSRHYVDAVGSRIGLDRVPCLYLYDGWPELCYRYLCNSDFLWGAASCGSRA